MKNERTIAYVLIIVGVLALLSNLGAGALWLWVGLVAGAFIAAYLSKRSYGSLVAGSLLSGVSVGLLLGFAWDWGLGAFWISVGVGAVVIDRVEPRRDRWPIYLGAVLIAVGILWGLLSSGVVGSSLFALLLIGVGIYLLSREGGGSFGRPWVRVEDEAGSTPERAAPPVTEPPSRHTSATTATPTAPNTTTTQQTVAGAPDIAAGVSTPPPETAAVSPAATAEEALDADAQARKRRLEAWRRTTAAAEETPAYMVLRNESILQIARENPQTVDDLQSIRGIGPVKLERYGETILEVIQPDTAKKTLN